MTKRRSGLEQRLFLRLAGFLRFLPRAWVRAAGRRLGDLVWRLDGKHRRIAESNLAFALGGGELNTDLRRTARRTFRHFGEIFLDMIWLARADSRRRDSLLTIEGGRHITAALEQGRGALLISAHFGHWEMAPALISRIGRLNVVARPLDNARLEAELQALRRNLGETVIPKQQASRRILRALRDNQMVAILMDQNVLRREAVFVDFFGKPAATTPGPATFHLRTGAPILPVFCSPLPGGRYHIHVHPPLRIDRTGDAGRDIRRITQACTHFIEEQIRLEPDLWFWFHDRWRTRPPAEPGSS